MKDYGATPKRERIIEQGKYITPAGVSSGIDMALYLADKIAGELKAKVIQLRIEYDPHPIYDPGNYLNAREEEVPIAGTKMEKDAKKDIGLLDMIKSERTILKIKNSLQKDRGN
jgi:hypothetical protein